MIRQSVSPAYFERLYITNPDPWDFQTSVYEKRKYDATLAALPKRRYQSGFEIGCSIGVLTRKLASRCRFLLAIDVSETSLEAAQNRCRDQRFVSFRKMRVPREWPSKSFDLVVISEILYFQSYGDQRATATKTLRSLRTHGVVILVHWLGETGTGRSGNQVATQFIRQTRRQMRVLSRTKTSKYRLDVLVRRGVPPL